MCYRHKLLAGPSAVTHMPSRIAEPAYSLAEIVEARGRGKGQRKMAQHQELVADSVAEES